MLSVSCTQVQALPKGQSSSNTQSAVAEDGVNPVVWHRAVHTSKNLSQGKVSLLALHMLQPIAIRVLVLPDVYISPPSVSV